MVRFDCPWNASRLEQRGRYRNYLGACRATSAHFAGRIAYFAIYNESPRE